MNYDMTKQHFLNYDDMNHDRSIQAKPCKAFAKITAVRESM